MEKQLDNLLDIFIKGYNQKKAELGSNRVVIGVSSGGQTKDYVEKDFYWCGFSHLCWKERGKYAPPSNKGLKKFLESKGYSVGHSDYYFRAKSGNETLSISYGNKGNGDHELQVGGYNAVARYLDSLGYQVEVYSALD